MIPFLCTLFNHLLSQMSSFHSKCGLNLSCAAFYIWATHLLIFLLCLGKCIFFWQVHIFSFFFYIWVAHLFIFLLCLRMFFFWVAHLLIFLLCLAKCIFFGKCIFFQSFFIFELLTFSYFSFVLASVVRERVSWAWIRAPSWRNCKELKKYYFVIHVTVSFVMWWQWK